MNFQLVIDSLTKIVTDIITFIPNLINGLIILLIGLLVARLFRFILRFTLERLRFDTLAERSGITASLRGLGISLPLSRLLAQAAFALLLLSFVITATRLMGLEAVARLLEQLLLFLPSIIAAVIIFVLGGMAAQFVGGLVSAALTTSGVANAERVGSFLRTLITIFVIILALGQLGVDTAILVTALNIAIATFGLAIGLAIGLGARSMVSHIFAGFYLRQRLSTGTQIVVGEVRGAVQSIGPVNTELTGAGGRTVLPNSMLLEAIIRTEPGADQAASGE